MFPLFNLKTKSPKTQRQKKMRRHAEQVVQSTEVINQPFARYRQVEPMGPETVLSDKRPGRQLIGKPMRGESVNIPKQEKQQRKFKIPPSRACATGPTVQQKKQKNKGRHKKNMGHHVGVISFRRAMDLDRPGRSGNTKDNCEQQATCEDKKFAAGLNTSRRFTCVLLA